MKFNKIKTRAIIVGYYRPTREFDTLPQNECVEVLYCDSYFNYKILTLKDVLMLLKREIPLDHHRLINKEEQ